MVFLIFKFKSWICHFFIRIQIPIIPIRIKMHQLRIILLKRIGEFDFFNSPPRPLGFFYIICTSAAPQTSLWGGPGPGPRFEPWTGGSSGRDTNY